MKKTLAKLLAVVMLLSVMLGVFSGCQSQPAASKELVLFTWAKYVPDDIISEFEEKTGAKVTFATFQSTDEMLTKLQAVEGADYDVVIASDYTLDIARREGLMTKIDKTKVTNYANLNPAYLSQFYDPDNEYTVPYAPGTPLIIYDPSKVTCEITGYNSLWDESLKDSVVMLDYDRVMIGFVLKSMGYSLNETDPEILKQAEEKLIALKPNIRALNIDNPYETMLSGEASVGLMFGSQVAWVYAEHPEYKVVYPEEGMGFGIDCAFIPSKAPNAALAQEFLNFLCDPQISARISMDENVMSINCNSAATEYLSEEYLANPVLHIPDEVLGNKEFIQDIGADAAEMYADIWNRFKQA